MVSTEWRTVDGPARGRNGGRDERDPPIERRSEVELRHRLRDADRGGGLWLEVDDLRVGHGNVVSFTTRPDRSYVRQTPTWRPWSNEPARIRLPSIR